MKGDLGDAVMTEPVARAARTMPFLGVRVGKGAREVLHHLSFDATLPLTKAHTLAALRADVAALRAWNVDAALVVDRSFRAALLARLAGIPMRVGHQKEGRGFLLTTSVPYDGSRYEATYSCDLARAAGIPVADDAPRLVPPEEAVEVPARAVGFQPGARYEAKRIPFEASRGLVAHLGASGTPVVLFGGPEERELCEQLATPGCTILSGSCTIAQTLAALSKVDAFVSADTGLAHMAFGVRTPSLVVFGPTNATGWTHGPPQSLLVAPERELARVTASGLIAAYESSRSSSSSS